MEKMKVGDKVRLKVLRFNKSLVGFKVGDTGEILEIKPNGYYIIKWDNNPEHPVTDSQENCLEIL
jgi:hypothetical protein